MRTTLLLLLGGAVGALAGDEPAPTPVDPLPAAESVDRAANEEIPDPHRQLYTGKVVLAIEALQRFGIKASDEMQEQVVLETFDGQLFPIVADWRGRAFYQDERLRDRKVELICLERPGVPYLQVLVVFTFDEKGDRTYTDYWCDVCAIPMYEVKPCECCQDVTRLRFTPQGLPDYLNARGRIPVGRKAKGDGDAE